MKLEKGSDMTEYEICLTCKGNHYEQDSDGNYQLCSSCLGVEMKKENSPQDTGHNGE